MLRSFFYVVSASLIIAMKLWLLFMFETSLQTSLGVLRPGRPPAFELRKRYLYPSQNQRPFGHWRESNPRISLSYNYYIVVPFMNVAGQIAVLAVIEM